jgi:hypothetical protein
LGLPETIKRGRSTVDELSKSWSSLKSSVGDLVDKVESGLIPFQALLRRLKRVRGVANSATQKATVLVKQINKAIT